MKFFLSLIFTFSFAYHCSAGVRVGSLSLASDEIVYELLKRAKRVQDIVAVSSLALDHRYSHIAEDALAMKRVIGSSPEELWMIDADLWIGASYNRSVLFDVVRKKKQRLVVLKDFSRLEDIRKHIYMIGEHLGVPKHAKKLVREFDQKLSLEVPLKNSLKVILWSANGVVAGKQTLWDDLVSRLGGNNVVQHQGWKKISVETLAVLRPDVVITTESPHLVATTPGWNLIPAVQNKKVVQVQGRSLSSVSHHIVKAFDELRLVFERFSN
ncbi:MAG: ABC transporter substrate-binding protein [Oligoflexales bacterium]